MVAEFSKQVGAFVSKGTELSQLRNNSTNLEIQQQEAIMNERWEELMEISVPRQEDEAEAQGPQVVGGHYVFQCKTADGGMTALSAAGARIHPK